MDTIKYSYSSVLTIAGFDGSGGAGIQADIKTISALGSYATSILTALPVQNTVGVKSIHAIPASVVKEQIQTILEDIYPSSIKIGMVHTAELVGVIMEALKDNKVPIVFDPVMVATSGHRLIETATVAAIIERLIPLADIITPNLQEASILADIPIHNVADMYLAGEKIMKTGCKSVLIKGGHLESDQLTSLYFANDSTVHEFTYPKLNTQNTHGSGCTLSSAIATYIAQGETFLNAITLAQEFVHRAIAEGINVKTGKGNGPLHHFYNPKATIKYSLE